VKNILLVVLVLALCLSTAARALEDWTDQVPGFSPSGRNKHHLCYISPGQALLYGGRLGVGGFLTDQTFLYDIRTNTWTLESLTVSPPARENGDLAFIGDDGALLFGGSDGTPRDDTWRYDTSESTWTFLNPSVRPTPRQGHRMAFLGGDKILLFGGLDGTASDETWIFDLSESTWTAQAPPVSPSGRWDHDLAFIGGGKVLLFGGRDSTQFLADTWVYDVAGDTWTQLSPPTGPAARYGHAMAHIGDDRVALFGGRAGVIYDDTWIFDLDQEQWTRDLNTVDPSPRHFHGLSETSLDGSGHLVLFAGFFDIDDTWTFGGGDYLAFPPREIGDLVVHLTNDALQLSWSYISDDIQGNPIFVDRYVVYRGDVPDFEPGYGDSIGTSGDVFFADATAAVGDTGVNHVYVVRAVSTGEKKSADSNRVGEFDRPLGNGSQPATVRR